MCDDDGYDDDEDINFVSTDQNCHMSHDSLLAMCFISHMMCTKKLSSSGNSKFLKN